MVWEQKPKIPKASSILADQIRDRIVRGRLPRGTELPNEAELIESSGFSRGTVREALRLLESQGLIAIRRGSHGGVQVDRPDIGHVTRSTALLLALSDARLADLFEFRRLLEPAAAALAARNATAEQRAQLLAVTSVNAEERLTDTVGFHALVAGASGNEFHRVTLLGVLEIAQWHAPEGGHSHDELGDARRAHRRVAECISAGDAEGAAQAMARHLAAFEAVAGRDGALHAPIFDSPAARNRLSAHGSD
jgi:GntR family transcriptional repressor for pyruvate dehydrogenase complex